MDTLHGRHRRNQRIVTISLIAALGATLGIELFVPAWGFLCRWIEFAPCMVWVWIE